MTYPAKTGPTFEYDPDSGAATNALLQDIVDELVEIKEQPRVEFSREVWIDANGLTFIRTETRDEVTGAITVSYVDAGGATVSPVAPFLPFASGDRELVRHCYTAINNGAGSGSIGWGASWGSVWGGFAGVGSQYSIGDKITRINVIDPITGGTFQAFWFNDTTGLYIAQPLQADIAPCEQETQQIISIPQVWVDFFGKEFQVYSREVTSYDAGYATTAIQYSSDGINWAAVTPPTLPPLFVAPVSQVRLGYLAQENYREYAMGKNYASGTLSATFDPDGNGAVWLAPPALSSLTIVVRSAGNTPSSVNRVEVTTSLGYYYLTDGDSRSWDSYAVDGIVAVEAKGNSAFDAIWTERV